MTELTDDDWLRLSAYLDSELSAPERRAFARRLAREPALAAAAADLRSQSESLKRIRPAVARAFPTWIRPAVLSGAVAAGVAVAVLVARPDPDGPDLAAIHRTFIGQSYPVAEGGPAEAGLHAGAPLPDLTPAGLSLVTARELPVGIAAHYVGRNGCRLTLLRLEAGVGVASDGAEIWSIGDRRYAVKPDGMDPGRLAAIRRYLRAVTDPAESADRLALARRVADTKTCA